MMESEAKVKRKFTVFTDGSANNHIQIAGRVGGYAGVILEEDQEPWIVQGSTLGINSQQAELMAIVISLYYIYESLGKDEEAVIFVNSDSAYIVNCFKERWYEKWIATDYSMVKNQEYWTTILELSLQRGMRVYYKWVPGHKGIDHNEKADRLALQARQEEEQRLMIHG